MYFDTRSPKIARHRNCFLNLPNWAEDIWRRNWAAVVTFHGDLSGEAVADFCYPSGLLDRGSAEVVRRTGYSYACAAYSRVETVYKICVVYP